MNKKQNGENYFSSEIFSSELDLPKPSKNFNISLKKFTECTSYVTSTNQLRRISTNKSINVENDLEIFLKSERAERIRVNLMKIFELQHQKELEEIKRKRKKIFRFSSNLNVPPNQKIFGFEEDFDSNIEAPIAPIAPITDTTSNLPTLSTQIKKKLMSLFR